MSQVITLDDLTAYATIAIASDRGQLVVDAMNQWVETRTNRVWGETKKLIQRYDWTYQSLWLRHMDIQSIDSVKLGWPGQVQQTLPSNSYFLNELGRVTFLRQFIPDAIVGPSAVYNDYLEVTYTYGTETVPDDLKMAVLGIAANFYNWAINNQRDISAVAVGSYNVQYANKRPNPSGASDPATNTADTNWAIIESYRQQRM